jgi:hypothetical protein
VAIVAKMLLNKQGMHTSVILCRSLHLLLNYLPNQLHLAGSIEGVSISCTPGDRSIFSGDQLHLSSLFRANILHETFLLLTQCEVIGSLNIQREAASDAITNVLKLLLAAEAILLSRYAYVKFITVNRFAWHPFACAPGTNKSCRCTYCSLFHVVCSCVMFPDHSFTLHASVLVSCVMQKLPVSCFKQLDFDRFSCNEFLM